MKNDDDIRTVTLASYDTHTAEYLHKKVVLDEERTQQYWPGVEYFLSKLRPGDTIFEIGSGSGYDAQKIEKAGYKVVRSDASRAFLKHLKDEGFSAKFFDILNGPTPNVYAGIYCSAVLLHFNETMCNQAIGNIAKSLKPGGLLCLGMKLGEFEGWRDKGLSGKRYFKYWRLDELHTLLQANDFKVLHEVLSSDKGFVMLTAQLK